MPSPFPGMDPYLETPDIWPDFHDRLAEQISRDLNRTLPRPYYARLAMRPEVGILGGDPSRCIVPDVAITRPRHAPAESNESGVAVLDQPRTDISPSVRLRVSHELPRHHFVEIRDSSRGHALVTLIEIVSPSNKRPGPDRRAYEAKQREILDSDISLIELDLLRTGEPIVGGPALIESASRLNPLPDYLMAVNRAWQRGADLDFELFPIGMTKPLPCIAVPLRDGEPEVPLDLQYTFNQAYDAGPYARRGGLRRSTRPTAPARSGRLADRLPEAPPGMRP